MFHTLENTWEKSARRGWITVASFGLQAMALSLLLLVPLFTVEGLMHIAWFDPQLFTPPSAPSAPAHPSNHAPTRHAVTQGIDIVTPSVIPSAIPRINDVSVAPAPDLTGIGVRDGTESGGTGIPGAIIGPSSITPMPPPTIARPLIVSHLAEANLINHVQPNYPSIARMARIQGTVELRAIISKTGSIENLTVISGHAMLVQAALQAVRQWRYRPYLLNGEPIEVETDITVKFTLGGN
ncbi:MAG: energy transducer TonB [Mycobacterium sp.]